MNLFGETETRVVPLRNRYGSFNINPCLAVFGKGDNGKRCKDCKFLRTKQFGKKYFKCALRGDTNGPSTDHRKNWPSCGKFEQIDNDGALCIKEADLIAIKSQLLAGRRITVQSVLKSVHTQELRTYIPILRRQHGLDIKAEWVTNGNKRYKEYFLNPAA